MNNFIKYYYNIDVDKVKEIDENYLFNNYYFVKYYKKIDIKLYNYLIINNYMVDNIIYNKDNNYITIYDNSPYILLKIYKIDQINIDMLLNYNIEINGIVNWANLWSIKIDYYEKDIINIKNYIIKQYFNYYIGLCENAISLYKTLNLEYEKKYVCHLRLNNEIDFYNPMNLVVDYKMRDIAEYIKYRYFYHNCEISNDVYNIISNASYNDAMLLLIRLLYPSYFFDSYDNYKKNNQLDLNFVDYIDSYEQLLKKVYNLISKRYNIPKVEWLI